MTASLDMTTSTFTVRVENSQIKRLEALAKSTGRSRSFLTAEAIDTYLEVNEWQVAGIEKAMASIDANGGVDHADVKDWVASWSNSKLPSKAPRARKA
jgi:RHH-type transcriptional regulator, rel operon repressor / antitoxin RelB